MQINCNKIDKGVEVKVYIPQSELENLVMESKKPLRISRSFNKFFSKAQCELVEKVLRELYSDFNRYESIYKLLGIYGISDTLKITLLNKLDSFESDNLNNIVEFCSNIIFNKDTPLEIYRIRNKYNLSDSDLIISLVGNFGYGKTTLVKKLLGFTDDFKFLLVDNGRTTICPTFIRGLIVDKEEKVHFNKNIDGYECKTTELASKYEYCNRITLFNKQEMYNRIIVDSLNKAFDYKKGKNNVNPIDIIKLFVESERCSLDTMFGEVNEENCNNDGFYKVLLSEFNKIDDNINPNFSDNKILEEEFEKVYDKILLNYKEKYKDLIDFDEINNEIIFKLTRDDFSEKIDYYYDVFTNNSFENRGKSLRACLKEIYLEIEFSCNPEIKSFYTEDMKDYLLFPEDIYEYDSFVFVDTVGCGHEKKVHNIDNSKIDNDIQNNNKILNESDIIILIDKSTDSMRSDVENQIKSLNYLGFTDKLLICYSFYNQFVKGEIATDKEREDILKTLLKNSLVKLYPPRDNERVSMKSIKLYEDLQERIIFLKGLKPYNFSEDISIRQGVKEGGRKKLNFENDSELEKIRVEKLKKLNLGINNNTICLIELIEKIIKYDKFYKMKKNQKATIKSFHNKDEFSISYTTNVLEKISKEYLDEQYRIYMFLKPEYNTTGALCRNALIGNAIHYGSIDLTPILDLTSKIQTLISDFLDNEKDSFLVLEENIDNIINKDFLIDQIKSNMYPKIVNLCDSLFINAQKVTWKKLADDCGEGVKHRRNYGIYTLLKDNITINTFQFKIFEMFKESINEMIERYNIVS